jgi:TRAP-type mannitol/chloroaromatic compound transport system substrate-binding protein
MGWTVAQYYFAKNPAFAAIGGGVPLGINAAQFVRWLEGEGKRVRADLYAETLPVMALACSINGPKGLWLRKEVRRLEDLKGLRLRVGGTSALSLQSTGIVSQQLSAAEIYPALEKGTIDGLEWFTPPMDEKLGWHKVAKYYYYPFGEPTFSTVSDLLINRRVWDELDPSSRNLLESACQQQLRSDSSKLADGVSASLARFKAGGTAVASVPDTIIATHRQGAEAYLDQNVRSPAGLAAWRSLKAAR